MRRHPALFIALALITMTATCADKPPAKPDREARKELMRKKLTHAQQLLEGIALGDMKKVGEHAAALRDITKDPAWKVFKTERYLEHSSEFGRLAGEISENARDGAEDEAALHYLGLTMTCVYCHKYVRDASEL